MDYHGLDVAATQPAVAPAPAPAAQPGLNSVETYQKAERPPADPVSSAIDFWRDPERLRLAAMAAAEAQDPQMLAWLKRGHEAAEENTIDALGALVAGNKDRALQLFNATGQQKAAAIEDGQNGMHTIVFGDGTKRQVDAKKEFYSFLTPPQMAAKENNDENRVLRGDVANAKLELDRSKATSAREVADARTAQRDAENSARGAEREARIGLMIAQTGRAERAGQPKDGDAADTSEKAQARRARDIKTAVKAMRQIDPMSRQEVGEYDDTARTTIEGIALKLSRKGMRADEAVEEAVQTYDGLKGKAASTIDGEVKAIQGKKGWFSGPDWGGAKSEAEFRANRTKEIVSGGLRDLADEQKPTTSTQGQAPASAPRNDAVKRPTSGAGATPKTAPSAPAPMATTTKQGASPGAKPRYPDGARLKGKDGRQYIVKGGQPVLVQ